MWPHLRVELLTEALEVVVNARVVRALFDDLLYGVGLSREAAILPPYFSAIDVVLTHVLCQRPLDESICQSATQLGSQHSRLGHSLTALTRLFA